MAAGVPPPPLNSPSGSYYWLEWYTNLTNFLNGTNIPWSNLNFTGSNLTDILTRNHNDLQNIQGGSGTGQTTGNHWHLSGRGYITSAGVGTGFPGTWTIGRVGAGLYTVTHNLGLTVPSISALGTSNTAGVIVQWIDLTAANTITIHCTNMAGTATDANVSLIVNT